MPRKAKAKPKPKAKPRKPRARRQAPVNRNTVKVSVVNRVGGGGPAAAPPYAGPDRSYFAFNPVFDAGGAKQPALPPANEGPPIASGPIKRVDISYKSPFEQAALELDPRWVPTERPRSREKGDPERSGMADWARSQLERSPTRVYPTTPDDFRMAVNAPLPPSTSRTPSVRYPTGIRQPHRRLVDPSASRAGSNSLPQQLAF